MSTSYVGVATPNTIYAILDKRDDFDKIDRPMKDPGKYSDGSHVLVKTVEQEGVTVIFQHWIICAPLLGAEPNDPAGAAGAPQ